MPADKGRRTGRTRDLKIQAYFTTLSDKEKVEARTYVNEEGHMIGSNTLDTIPPKYNYLVKFKYLCKFCGDYHSHSAGAIFCDKNPDKQAAIENARKKAAYYYYDKNRKGAINHGKNIHSKRNSETTRNRNLNLTPEQREKQYGAVSRAKKGKKISEKHKKALAAGVERYFNSPEVLENKLEKENIVAPIFSTDIFKAKQKMNQDGFVISEDDNDFKRDEFSMRDEFSNRKYDINGDFDPF